VETALEGAVARAARAEEIRSTLATGGAVVLVADAEAALQVVDVLAPEHVEVMTADAASFAERIRNAGAIFVGRYAPAALGDYIVGTNHVLPTGQAARYASALRVDDFQKHLHVVTVTRDGLAALGPAASVLAEAEGLSAHAASVRARLEPAGDDVVHRG
jgi:histidinol dehydrogenase